MCCLLKSEQLTLNFWFPPLRIGRKARSIYYGNYKYQSLISCICTLISSITLDYTCIRLSKMMFKYTLLWGLVIFPRMQILLGSHDYIRSKSVKRVCVNDFLG